MSRAVFPLAFAVALAACAGGRTGAPAAPPAELAPPMAAPQTRAEPEPAVPDAPLPLPLPPPSSELSDPLDLLWGHRLEFGPGGEPVVTIRLMEGQRAIAFRPLAAARVRLRGGGDVQVPAGARLRVTLEGAVPAAIAYRPLLAEARWAERARLEAARRTWAERGVPVRSRVVGGVYGLAGKVVDGRRELLLAATDGAEATARAEIERLRARHGARPMLDAELVSRPSGRLALAAGGGPLGEADGALVVDVEGDAGVVVEEVEHERGPGAPAREDRTYRGRLVVAVDARGTLVAVHAVSLEELLRGLVPSEMPAGSHPEALKAQAVTARSNVLAQIGSRHLTDPFMLCAEVHCQSYRGDAARTARTDEAVRATRGEALFGREDGVLVDAVYSAMCGGHGEHNDQVWGNTPSASLRGHPDLPEAAARRWAGGLAAPGRLEPFLADASEAYCRRPAAAPAGRFRWERRLGPTELDAAAAALGVGHVTRLEVLARGVSGRARLLRVVGDRGHAEVSGELRIRRLLGNLPSSMFVVERDGAGVRLRGGGWGHGAGMCQWGAVGRAEAGQGYREILRAYYSGAEVARFY